MKRRVPQLTDFLAGYSGRDRATVGNTIRKCRAAGLLSQGRPGRGAAEVTSQDSASVLLALLGADQPLEAAAILAELHARSFKDCASDGEVVKKPPKFPGLPARWYRRTLTDALVANIEARRRDPAFHGMAQISVRRGFGPRAKLDWRSRTGRWFEFSYDWDPHQRDSYLVL